MSTRMKLITVALVAFLLGTLVAQNMPYLQAQEKEAEKKVKSPNWQYGVSMKVRKSSDLSFDSAPKFGIEVYKDENNGNLVYISENGSIAVVPGK